MPQVVTRFAPSPTGRLHIGGARTALFNWAYARRHGGKFVLRIEDTDQRRSSDAATRGILRSLAWMGIGWDYGPAYTAPDGRTLGGQQPSVGSYYQSERLDEYDRRLRGLIEQGLAYPAFESPEELEAKRQAAIAAKTGYKYDRSALDIPLEQRIARMDAGESHVVRFRMPDGPVTVHDRVLGDVTVQPEELDDFIIRKRDGFPTYHFAVVVDDAAMGVTHVLRGQEHLINTPRHVALQRALGFETPVYAHMPLIFNPDGSKMSKRDKDKTAKAAVKAAGLDAPPVGSIDPAGFAEWLEDKTRQMDTDHLAELAAALKIDLPEIDAEDFQAAGYLASTLVNFLALLGWNPKTKNPDGTDLERFDADYLAAHFDFDGLGKTASKFDRQKLLAFSGDDLTAMDDGAFADAWRGWAERFDPELAERFSAADMRLLAPAVKPRCKTLRDGRSVIGFALVGDDAVEFDGKAVHKVLIKGDRKGLETLRELKPIIAAIEPFTPETVEVAVGVYADSSGLGMGKVAQPLRVAVTGTSVSPPLGQTLAILGRDRVLARIDRCIASVEAQAAEVSP
ncbi:MAG: glutamate--tRNA ligase [Phycisphaerales bacterium]|nr:glutamate--tRNA ligase [Planctomycetota bacterium]MCH8508980.1 glutamate--tRNA ligase [Phycisphaerales bacterium]